MTKIQQYSALRYNGSDIQGTPGMETLQPCMTFIEPDAMMFWYPEGIGFLSCSTLVPYDKDYWLKYNSYRGSDIGKELTAGRLALAEEVITALQLKGAVNVSDILDIGIGSGEFVEAANCFGTDINPHAVEWLNTRGKLSTIEKHTIISLWDVLEHIEDPEAVIGKANVVLTSLPIHESMTACLASKHLRPGEHLWHFTDAGIKRFMSLLGFKHITTRDFETRAGREGIATYVFSKVNIRLETN